MPARGVDPAAVAKRMGLSLLVLLRTCTHAIDDLDPRDRLSMDELIANAQQVKRPRSDDAGEGS